MSTLRLLCLLSAILLTVAGCVTDGSDGPYKPSDPDWIFKR
jgi:hypothetical protein